uniref:Uncharacterized protein n=1 Tax=Rhizophora mucronata TaxID=61149 RepID=A0A2P2QFC4_RHIMU
MNLFENMAIRFPQFQYFLIVAGSVFPHFLSKGINIKKIGNHQGTRSFLISMLNV